ncbi:ROK family protein [Streptomyces sp. NPDC101393]|uniref:ROK family protein n=1 Tax=Streptomyces sp. NPDC101393 TaxID=3366141 RepID=UPI00381B76C8
MTRPPIAEGAADEAPAPYAAAPTAPLAPAIGLDLGGTKIAAALVAADGTITARHTVPTPGRDGPDAVLDALATAARAVLPCGGRAPAPTGIGVAACGVIDPVGGLVRAATDQIRNWTGAPLGPGLAARTGLPVACDNDVRAAAGPEFAALPGPAPSLAYLSVGTGIGGAVAVDGRMLHGHAGIAGHLGHLPSPEATGLPCSCGATGHVEAIASGPGITALYGRLSGSPVARLEHVVARAAAGDATAAEAIRIGGQAAGRTLGGLANAFGPGHVVVGGGVPRTGARYWAALRAGFASEVLAPLRALVPRPPRHGHDSPLLGAAALVTTLPLHHPSGALV